MHSTFFTHTPKKLNLMNTIFIFFKYSISAIIKNALSLLLSLFYLMPQYNLHTKYSRHLLYSSLLKKHFQTKKEKFKKKKIFFSIDVKRSIDLHIKKKSSEDLSIYERAEFMVRFMMI